MKKVLLSSTVLATLATSGVLAQSYDASGTEYSNALAAQETWSEDLSNMFVEGPNSFACIIANSGPSVNANANWTALIDEVACGLEEPNENVQGTIFSNATLSSSRASNETPQEVVAYFNAQSGEKFIANVVLRESAEDVGPYGSWYFSYFQPYADIAQGSEWNSSNSPRYGYADVSQTDDNNIQIVTAQKFSGTNANGSFDGSKRALVRYLDGNPENTVFIGENVDNWTPNIGQPDNRYDAIAGSTSATHYYRVGLGGSEQNPVLDPNTAMCYSRDNKFTTAHDIALYDPTTGEKVDMESGFDFATSDNNRGYYGSWGIWVEGDPIMFSPDSRSEAITRDGGVTATLKWAPGKLRKQSFTTVDLQDDDTFRDWIDGDEVELTWDEQNQRFDYVGINDANVTGQLSSTEWSRWFWSQTKRTNVIWDGEDSVRIVNSSDVLFNSDFADATSTKFYSKYRWNPLTDPSMLPITLTEFNSNGTDNFWDNNDTNRGGTNGQTQTYHLTGSAPGGNYEPNTLYLDADASDTLSANDKPVRFDFAVDDSRTSTLNYADASEADYTEQDQWPGVGFALTLASDVTAGKCTKPQGRDDYQGANCPRYEWQTGAFEWDHSIVAFDSAGEKITLDDPIMFEITYDKADDRNNGVTIASLSTKDYWNPIPGCQLDQDGYQVCTNVSIDLAHGEKFVLEYNGYRFNNIPGLQVCDTPDCSAGNYWMYLLNMKDGTTVTDVDGKEYVTLARATSSQFLEAQSAECSDISFTSLAEIGLDDSAQYPQFDRNSADYPLPTQAWDDQPTESACTVTMGDISDCE